MLHVFLIGQSPKGISFLAPKSVFLLDKRLDLWSLQRSAWTSSPRRRKRIQLMPFPHQSHQAPAPGCLCRWLWGGRHPQPRPPRPSRPRPALREGRRGRRGRRRQGDAWCAAGGTSMWLGGFPALWIRDKDDSSVDLDLGLSIFDDFWTKPDEITQLCIGYKDIHQYWMGHYYCGIHPHVCSESSSGKRLSKT